MRVFSTNKLGISYKLLKVLPFVLLAAAAGIVLMDLSTQMIQKSILMVLTACVLISFQYFPQPPIGGPFNVLWKITNGVCFFYLLCLIFLAFHTREESIQAITTYIDPSLKLMNYEEVSYAQDCKMINHEKENPYESFFHAFFDIFALAHFLGWFFKTIICRDLKLIFFASVTFELIEYSLRNVLNNFKECWWDHVIIDMFGCNLLGIICGFIFIDKFGLDRYRWSLRSAPLQFSHWENFKRFWTSLDVSYLQTKAFGSLRPFIKMVILMLMFQANDLNLFFVKYIYHLPPPHFLCFGRLVLVGLLTFNAVREYYDFMKHRAKFRKVNILLFTSIILMEIFIVIKQGEGEFDHAFIDNKGKLFLGSIIAIFLIYFVKIGISDIYRKLKGLKQRRSIIFKVKVHAEHAKLSEGQIKQQ